MSVYQVVLGSAWIVLGTLTGARLVIALTLGSARPEMSRPGARTSKWRLLGGSVNSCLIGIFFVAGLLHGSTTRWLLGIAGTALLVWYVSSDLGSWRRARRGRADGPVSLGLACSVAIRGGLAWTGRHRTVRRSG